MRSRMLKLVRTGVVFLLLGIIINISVAWGCVLWCDVQTSLAMSEPEPWPVSVPSEWPMFARLFRSHGFGVTHVHGLGKAPAGRENSIRNTAQEALLAGFPLRSLYCERHRLEVWTGLYAPMFMFDKPKRWQDGISIPPYSALSHYHGIRHLPTLPLPLGFVIDTITYTACVWVTFSILRRIRRAIRWRAGLCELCGYDLRGAKHERCPECGVSPRARTVSGATA